MSENEEQDPDYHWWTGEVKCYICKHKQISKIEIPKEYQEPFVPLECEKCGNMSCHPK